VTRKRIKAQMWQGGRNEIYRFVEVDGDQQIEYLPANAESFTEFRCFHERDIEEIIKEAMKGK